MNDLIPMPTACNTRKPAPWYVISEGLQEAAIGYRAIIDADGYTVCNPSPMGEANARLIAAAPALLEALFDALPYVEDVLDNPEQLACFKAGTVQRHAKAIRAAIAKATGDAL